MQQRFVFSCGLTLVRTVVVYSATCMPLKMCYKMFIFIIFCFGKHFTEYWLITVANCYSESQESVETINIDSFVSYFELE